MGARSHRRRAAQSAPLGAAPWLRRQLARGQPGTRVVSSQSLAVDWSGEGEVRIGGRGCIFHYLRFKAGALRRGGMGPMGVQNDCREGSEREVEGREGEGG